MHRYNQDHKRYAKYDSYLHKNKRNSDVPISFCLPHIIHYSSSNRASNNSTDISKNQVIMSVIYDRMNNRYYVNTNYYGIKIKQKSNHRLPFWLNICLLYAANKQNIAENILRVITKLDTLNTCQLINISIIFKKAANKHNGIINRFIAQVLLIKYPKPMRQD